MRLTDLRAVLHARTGARVAEIAVARQDVKAGLGGPSGRLRVSVPLLFAQTSLGGVAAAFLAAFPGVLLRLASPLSMRDAVLAGAGIALIPRTIAIDALASGHLVSSGLSTQPATEIRAPHGSHRLVSPKVSSFVNFVCDDFGEAEQQDLLTRS